MNVLGTLAAGYKPAQILNYLAMTFPWVAAFVTRAKNAGHDPEAILNQISKLDPNKFKSGSKGQKGSQPYPDEPQDNPYIQARRATKEYDPIPKGVKYGLAGAAGLGALGAGAAAYNAYKNRAIMPSAILPPLPKTQAPRQLPGQTPRGLPHLGPKAPGPTPPSPAPQAGPAAPAIRPTGQPVQTPATIPMGGPQAPKMSGGQILQNLGLMATLSNLARNNPNLSPQDLAGVLKTVEPAKVGQLVKDKSVNLPQIVEEALQELQTQPQQQPQAQQPQQPQETPNVPASPEQAQAQPVEPLQPQEAEPREPIKATLPISAKEKIESATYAPAFLKKLSEHDISKRQFSIPTYKLPSESPQDFANREIMDSAIIKAAKALEEEKSFLDFPEPWGKAYIEEKVISRGPRKGVVEKTGKSHDIYDRSTAADVLRFMSGVPNVYDALLDEAEKKELNQRLLYGHESIQAALPSGDPNIYGAQMTPNLVWNLLLSVEPRLQTVDKPKSVKGHKMSPGGVMGSTEFRRYLTHAVYRALSGKTITTQLADKIQKISKAAMETDALAEAAKTGRLNAAIEEQERLMQDDDYFFSLFTEEIQRKVSEIKNPKSPIEERLKKNVSQMKEEPEQSYEKIYHTSPEEIKNIHEQGRFGKFLFFSNRPYVMTAKHDYETYSLNKDKLNLIEASRLFNKPINEKTQKIINNLSELIGVDEDTAKDLLDETKDIYKLDDNLDGKISQEHDLGELSWDIQHMTARIAETLGYDGVEVSDEQGTSYMINMKGKEKLLRKEK